MRERFAKWIERATARLDTAGYIWTGLTFVSTYLTAHFASLNTWIAKFGPIGYWSAGLLGGLVVALAGLIIAHIRLLWMTGGAIDKWKKDVSAANPLDDQFTRLRLKFQDLAHPVSKRIANKTFVNCELMGPANIVVAGNSSFNATGFMNCDVVVFRPPPPELPIHNCIILESVNFIGGSIWNVTLFIPPPMAPILQGMGAQILTAIPNESPAPQSPLNTATGTLP
jgi:hypothetical protein